MYSNPKNLNMLIVFKINIICKLVTWCPYLYERYIYESKHRFNTDTYTHTNIDTYMHAYIQKETYLHTRMHPENIQKNIYTCTYT